MAIHARPRGFGRRRLAVALGFAVALLLAATGPAEARDKLVIGMTQYPATLNPNIDAMMAKSYLLGLTQRPFTVYDAEWKLVCLLCTGLPTFENGGAVKERTPDGKEGVAVTYTIQPNATSGRSGAIPSSTTRSGLARTASPAPSTRAMNATSSEM